jgi:hypothetical protein
VNEGNPHDLGGQTLRRSISFALSGSFRLLPLDFFLQSRLSFRELNWLRSLVRWHCSLRFCHALSFLVTIGMKRLQPKNGPSYSQLQPLPLARIFLRIMNMQNRVYSLGMRGKETNRSIRVCRSCSSIRCSFCFWDGILNK